MNKIKAAIIEDEIPAARLLRDTLLSLRPDWDVQLLVCPASPSGHSFSGYSVDRWQFVSLY